MARKLRLQYEGAIYHITVRGNARQRIFLEDADRERFLRRLSESRELYDVRVFLFCLMDNHFHLLVETPRGNISAFMQSLLTGYTVYFNLKHRRCGHLVQGRYGAQCVQGDTYLLRLSRYIHLNPVRTRKARAWDLAQKRRWLRAYRWSSYRGYIDERQEGELVEHGPVLAMTQAKRGSRRIEYRRYTEAGLAVNDEELQKLLGQSPRAIGGEEFRRWVDEAYEKLRVQQGSAEDVSFRRESSLQDTARIIAVVKDAFGVEDDEMRRAQRGSLARPFAAWLLCKHAGLTQREAGRKLGYRTGSAVSHQLANLRIALSEDKSLAKQMRRIEQAVMTGGLR